MSSTDFTPEDTTSTLVLARNAADAAGGEERDAGELRDRGR
jgi:hypothetical protein